jgi:N6-L-threonylcarbamoyladenine synthase
MGEVFDKVGKRLGLLYPQGPRVDALAERATPPLPQTPRRFATPFRDDTLDFSYSGLKSQALQEIEKLERALGPLDLGTLEDAAIPTPVLDLLAAFRAATVAQIVDRLGRLHERRPIPLLAVSGGVAANRLRRELSTWAERHGVALRLVPLAYAGDNAAMIAHAALLRHRRGWQDDPFAAEAESRIALHG